MAEGKSIMRDPSTRKNSSQETQLISFVVEALHSKMSIILKISLQ